MLQGFTDSPEFRLRVLEVSQGFDLGLTLGDVWDMVVNSTEGDTDGDRLPDDVEKRLGTDPINVDTDHDGMNDFNEIFPTDPSQSSMDFDAEDRIPNMDKDNLIAALDADDDNDGQFDGDNQDSDGDGIPNYLEYNGYTYDWLTGTYSLWNGEDYFIEYFKSDPHQKSTDQDPYDDNVEVAAVNMDVSVDAPGNLPMVPARPEIVAQLEGYAVTLIQEITFTEGESLSQGTTWESTTGASHSHTQEHNWEFGFEVGYSTTGFSGSFHANYGGSVSDTSTTSFSSSKGGSVTSEENWSRATTTNTAQAAKLKLFLKVHNNGSAVASNVIPTLTVRIGGHNIVTGEPGNAQINLLEPGGVYPATPGVYWVVDAIDTGAGIADITLTLNELRALESGAPISITMTQMAADVMQRNPETGVYESVGDWNEYMARIEAVSAKLFYDVGDGNYVNSLVYAGDSPTAPVVTLGDAMVWAAGGSINADGEFVIAYRDQDTGSMQEVPLNGWRIVADRKTYEANGFSRTNPPHAGFDLWKLRLNPDSVIVAKAPRGNVPGTTEYPQIYYAYYDSTTGGVNAVVDDYQGIKSVEFIDKDGQKRAMAPDSTGAAFYVYYPYADTENYENGYVFDGSELIRATNINDKYVQQEFIEVYTPKGPQVPEIVSVSLDLENHKLSASIIPDANSPLAWVRAYHPCFTEGSAEGYLSMQEVSNFFENPYGWYCNLPDNFGATEGITVVAFVQPGIYAKKDVLPSDKAYHITGSARLWAWHDWTGDSDSYDITALDLDAVENATDRWHLEWDDDDKPGCTLWNPPDQRWDLWLRMDDDAHTYDKFWGWTLHFNNTVVASYKYSPPSSAEEAFENLTEDKISGFPLELNRSSLGVKVNDIIILKTNQGRYAKLLITYIWTDQSGWPYENREIKMDIRYVAFNRIGIGDFVWDDVNRNGIQDPAEPGIANVTVNLYCSTTDTSPCDSDTTTNNGFFHFSPDLPGTYRIEVDESTLPEGYIATRTNTGNEDNDSNVIPAIVPIENDNSVDLSIDFGYKSPCGGSIGGMVWDDLNKDGIQDADEPGLANVAVKLEDGPGVLFEEDSIDDGTYEFTGLCAGEYTVTIVAPDDYAASPCNVGSDDTYDNDCSPFDLVLPDDFSAVEAIDFGYNETTTTTP